MYTLNCNTRFFPASNNFANWTTSYGNVPNIATGYTSWLQWKNKRISQFENKCPSNRSLTFYFDATNGNDSTGDGSIGNPYKTLSLAQTQLDFYGSSTVPLRMRFKRGEVWSESTGLNASSYNNITIDDYGTGNLPFFNCFSQQYTAGGWTLASGNRYTRAETNDIAWVREILDRLGETRGTHLIRMDSSANCEATANSFFWGTNVLHVNLNGDNPNNASFYLEAVISNTENGVVFGGDGCRCENIRADGYGCNRTTSATQVQPFSNWSTGNDANLFKGCEGYFSGSHVIAHYVGGSSGGKSMFLNCIAGFTKYNAGGETVFNTYSNTGGQETWFVNCTCKYGTLKSSDWTYTTSFKRGIAFYGHTSGGANYSDLIVKFNCTVPSSSYSQPALLSNHAGTLPGDGVITNARYFLVNSSYNCNSQVSINSIDLTSNGVMYGNKFYFKLDNTVNGNGWALDSPQYAWVINSYYEMNCTGATSNSWKLWNAPGVAKTNDNRIYVWNCLFLWTNNGNIAFAIDADAYNDTDAAPSATADNRNGEWKNNIYAYQTSTASSGFGFSNYATKQKNNAYYNVLDFTGQTRGYNLDPAKQTPGSLPALGVSQSQFLQTGTTDVMLSHDINGKRRTVATPDLGPVDFSS